MDIKTSCVSIKLCRSDTNLYNGLTSGRNIPNVKTSSRCVACAFLASAFSQGLHPRRLLRCLGLLSTWPISSRVRRRFLSYSQLTIYIFTFTFTFAEGNGENREADTNTSASAAGSENWGHTKENLSKFPDTIYCITPIYIYLYIYNRAL